MLLISHVGLGFNALRLGANAGILDAQNHCDDRLWGAKFFKDVAILSACCHLEVVGRKALFGPCRCFLTPWGRKVFSSMCLPAAGWLGMTGDLFLLSTWTQVILWQSKWATILHSHKLSGCPARAFDICPFVFHGFGRWFLQGSMKISSIETSMIKWTRQETNYSFFCGGATLLLFNFCMPGISLHSWLPLQSFLEVEGEHRVVGGRGS